MKTVLIPEENEKDLVDIPKKIKDDLEIRAVRWIDQVFEIALESMPKALEEKVDVEADASKKSDAKADTTQQVTTH